jgi:dTDP-4-amino-4,6-dideoxygalactose transaminase
MRFIDLAEQQKRIRGDVDARIRTVLDHGKYIMGPEVAELEAALADFAGAGHCVACASGTDALLMALMAWGIGPGDAVFVPSFSFFATAEVVAMLGAVPVMVDIEPKTFVISPQSLERAIEAVRRGDASLYPLPRQAAGKALRPRAVIPVDLFGQLADYGMLLPLAARHELLVLEDAAQAFGAEQGGKKACAVGCRIAATSFFPAKPLGCYGDGGALFTDDNALAEVLRSIRTHGKGADKYDNVRIGINGRMDTIQAAVLLAKTRIFPEEIVSRQEVAARYARGLEIVRGVKIPVVQEGNTSVWAQYCILLVAEGKRDSVAASLHARGIPTNIYYPTPMHMLAAFRYLGYAPGDMPASLAASGQILALPFHPYLREEDIDKVCDAIAESML